MASAQAIRLCWSLLLAFEPLVVPTGPSGRGHVGFQQLEVGLPALLDAHRLGPFRAAADLGAVGGPIGGKRHRLSIPETPSGANCRVLGGTES